MEDFRAETYVATYKLDDGMLSCRIKPDQIIDGRLAERITRERLEVCKGEIFPTLIEIPGKYLLLENGGLQFFGSEDGLKDTVALAIVMRSNIRTILTRFNFMFSKQRVPFRVFTSRSEAKLWLFGFMLDSEEASLPEV